MVPTETIDDLLATLPALHEVCHDPDVDQLVIHPNGGWKARKLGIMHPMQTPLTIAELGDLDQSMGARTQALAAQAGWLFRRHPSRDGWAYWGERLPLVDEHALDESNRALLRRHIEQGSNGVIIGPAHSRKNHILSWMATQYAQEQIVFVSELPPQTDLGARVLHLFPPKDREDARTFSRFLSQCDVVLWDRIAHPYDLQDCMGFVGATHRWMTLDANTHEAGVRAFARMWFKQNLGALGGVVFTHAPKGGASGIDAVVDRLEGPWTQSEQGDQALLELVQEAFEQDTAPTFSSPPTPPRADAYIDRTDLRVEGADPSDPFFAPRRSLDLSVPGLKSTFTGPPQSTMEELEPIASSRHEIFEDSEESSMAEFVGEPPKPPAPEASPEVEPQPSKETTVVSQPPEPPQAPAPAQAPALEQPQAQQVYALEDDDPKTTEVDFSMIDELDELDGMDDMDDMEHLVEVDQDIWMTQEDDAIARAQASGVSVHSTDYDISVLEAQDVSEALEEDSASAAHVSLAQYMAPPPPTHHSPAMAASTVDETREVELPFPMPPAGTVDLQSANLNANLSATNNVSGAQLDALLPQLSDAFDDEEDQEQTFSSLGTTPSKPVSALNTLDSLYALDAPDHGLYDEDDDQTLMQPLDEALAMARRSSVEHAVPTPKVQALAWGDDEQTINQTLSEAQKAGLLDMSPQPAGAPAPQPTSSSAQRLSNLSLRLKTLRQQRLEQSEASVVQEPAQAAAASEAEEGKSKFVIRNKQDLLKRLKSRNKE